LGCQQHAWLQTGISGMLLTVQYRIIFGVQSKKTA